MPSISNNSVGLYFWFNFEIILSTILNFNSSEQGAFISGVVKDFSSPKIIPDFYYRIWQNIGNGEEENGKNKTENEC